MNKKKKKKEFSKTLLIQESVLIWVLTIGFMILAYISILCGYTGSLPWLTAMSSLPWTAYGVSQVWYYKKSTVENQKDGVKFESVMAEVRATYDTVKADVCEFDADAIMVEYSAPQATEEEINLDYGI